MVKVTDSWLACHENDLSAAEDTLCRELKRAPIIVMWYLVEGVPAGCRPRHLTPWLKITSLVLRQAKPSSAKMAKFASLAVLTLVLGVCSAASFGGIKDLAGNYYDFSTGQYSSALTGKVYNTAPVAYVPPVAPVVAPAPAVPPPTWPLSGKNRFLTSS
ncbi:uncharacterized protein TNCV_1142401 [Trichonephila clavipes]|nr:uncharacterized protein TNCV_1142401 [Trichonephila clavipes]